MSEQPLTRVRVSYSQSDSDIANPSSIVAKHWTEIRDGKPELFWEFDMLPKPVENLSTVFHRLVEGANSLKMEEL